MRSSAPGLKHSSPISPDMDNMAEASTGAEVIETVRAREFDIVLLDILMPTRTGLFLADSLAGDALQPIHPGCRNRSSRFFQSFKIAGDLNRPVKTASTWLRLNSYIEPNT